MTSVKNDTWMPCVPGGKIPLFEYVDIPDEMKVSEFINVESDC